MAGKRDYNVVCVTTGMTRRQAGDFLSAVTKAKNSIAPMSRSTAGITTREGIGTILSRGVKMIAGK